MAWFKVDDKLHSHPKWTSLPPSAKALWVTAGSYCAAHLLDGFVPSAALPLLSSSRSAASLLVKSGLWLEVQDGYRFHDWEQYQPTRADVEARRAKDAERLRNWRSKRDDEGGSNRANLRAM